MHRRTFLQASASLATAGCFSTLSAAETADPTSIYSQPPAFSIVPIVGDGKWIWREPPEEESGYLEPRSFELEVGIELKGRGRASQIMATTPTPLEYPEQSIDDSGIKTQGCRAQIRKVSEHAAQLIMAAPSIQKGQTLAASARFKITLRKDYRGFRRDGFPAKQQLPSKFDRRTLSAGPGIQSRDRSVRELAKELSHSTDHPWDQAVNFHQWVWKNIEARIGNYTSVTKAIKNRIGDCEERAAVFVALCRASNIPARLVWIPNHNWAEFYLVNHEGEGHWIPVHTAAYSWFGWTGVHELVLQKGDNVYIPERRLRERLVSDWMQWQGARPEVSFSANLIPVAQGDTDPGPGARSKDKRGRWLSVGKHPMDSKGRTQ